MSYDVLFQLGMGSVGLAPQKEEHFAIGATMAHAGAHMGVFRPVSARLKQRQLNLVRLLCTHLRGQERRRMRARLL